MFSCHRTALAGSALVLLIAAAVALPASARRQQTPIYRGGVELVHAGVVVTDRQGRLVSDLTAEDFIILEDGVEQQVQYFAAGAGPGPELHLGLLLDVSESMIKDIEFTRAAAIKFLNGLREALDITVVDFDAEVRSTRFVQADFARLVERIRRQKVQGFTALYDAIGLYLDSAAAQDGRTIMILYTDGTDTRSALRFPELMDLLKASDVTVYAIGALEHQSSTGRAEARMRLSQIADVTAGQAFFPLALSDLTKTYAQLVAEVRAQYTLGYASGNTARDGRWRAVEVKVRRADVRVRARRGYYAPSR